MKNYYYFILAILFASTFLDAQTQCPDPVGFNIVRTSPTEATVTVNSTDSSIKYDLYVDLYGNRAPLPTDTPQSTFHNLSMPYTNNTLIAENEYSVWIRRVCVDGGNSEWVGPVNVLEYPTCEEPQGFNIVRTSPTEATATVNSTDSSIKYDLYIDLYGNRAPLPTDNPQSTFHNLSMPFSTNLLDPNNEYSIWIRRVCDGENSEWVGPVNILLFNNICSVPNVTAQRTSNTSATVGTDSGYWDMYLDIYNTAPSNTSVPQSTYDNRTGSITNNSLNPSYTYYTWFRRDCDPQNNNTDVSDWVGPYVLAPAPMAVQLNAGAAVRVDNFKVATAQIISINGRSQAVKVNNNEVNTSSLAPGKYILNVTDANGRTESLPFIKK